MDELSPEAEAKDMELVATRGEEAQGSEEQFSPPLGGNEVKRTLRRRGFARKGDLLSARAESRQRRA